jgi:hypothetical protein
MKARNVAALLIIIAHVAAAPSPAFAPAGKSKLYAGTFIRGFESSAFRPEDGPQLYWASGRALRAAHARLMTASPTGYGETFIVVCGLLSGPGRFGHLGQYARELSVTRVISFERDERGKQKHC